MQDERIVFETSTHGHSEALGFNGNTWFRLQLARYGNDNPLIGLNVVFSSRIDGDSEMTYTIKGITTEQVERMITHLRIIKNKLAEGVQDARKTEPSSS